MESSETQNLDSNNDQIEDDDGIASIRKAFSDFDQDGDGTISIAELRIVLGPGGALGGMKLNNEEIDTLISVADKDGDGEISFEEFVNLVQGMKGGDSEEDMRRAFKIFDVDGDGAISKEDMKEAMLRLGNKLTDRDIENIFKESDIDDNGVVTYEEFVRNITEIR